MTAETLKMANEISKRIGYETDRAERFTTALGVLSGYECGYDGKSVRVVLDLMNLQIKKEDLVDFIATELEKAKIEIIELEGTLAKL